MVSDEEQASCQERTEDLVRILLRALTFSDDWDRGGMLEETILRHVEPRPYYNEQEAADTFAMTLGQFRRKAKSVGLEPSGCEEGTRSYTWDRLIPHVERYWSKRIRRGW